MGGDARELRGAESTSATTPSDRATPTATIFISYAREDQEFVRQLHDALSAAGRDVWVDWGDIPLTADWRREIDAGIDAADAFVVVLTPDWVASQPCQAELDRAVAGGKRLVPLLRRDVDPGSVPDAVAALNWIPASGAEAFEGTIASLTAVLDTNLERVKAHTRHEVQARDWENSGGDRSQLLRGASLREAEQFLLDMSTDPLPTALQVRFITTSRRAAVRTQRRLISAVTAALVVSVALSILALVQRDRAIEQSNKAESRALAAESLRVVDSNADRSLRLAIDAMDKEQTPQAVAALRTTMAKPRVAGAIGTRVDHAQALARTVDGRWVFVALQSGEMRLWDTRLDRFHALCGRQRGIQFANFSFDGRYVVTNALGGNATVWRVPITERLSTRCDARQVAELVGQSRTAGVLNADGSRAAVVTFDGSINVIDVATNTRVRESLHGDLADSIELSPDGGLIATRVNSDDRQGTVRVWDIAGGTNWSVQRPLPINIAHFSHDGALLVTAGEYGSVEVWDAASAQSHIPPLAHDGDVTDAEFDPGDQLLLTTAHDGGARVWEVATGRPNVTLLHAASLRIGSFAATRPFVLTTDAGNALTLWDAADRRQLEKVSVPGNIKFSDLSGAGTLSFIEQKDDGGLRLWRERSWRVFSWLKTQGSIVSNEQAFSRNRKRVAIGVGGERVVQVRRLPTGETIGNPVAPQCNGLPWNVLSFALSPNGRTLATNAYTSTAGVHCKTEIWDVETGTREAQVGEAYSLAPMGFSRDSRLLAIADNEDAATVWLADVHTPTSTPQALENTRRQVCRTLACDHAADHDVRLWDVAHCGKPLAVLRGHSDVVIAAAFSQAGDKLVTGSLDHTAIIWDVRTRRKLAVLRGHADEVVGVDFSADGRFVVTRSGDVTYRIWDAVTGAPVDDGPVPDNSTGLAAVTFDRSSSSLLLTNSFAIFSATRGRPSTRTHAFRRAMLG